MTERAKRTTRRPGVRVILGSRDEALLRAVSRFRLATSADLQRLFFAGRHRDVLAGRLRKLYDTGFLETHVCDRAAPNIYSLGPEGKVWVRGQGGAVHGLPRPPWQHHLGIIALWSRLAAAAHQVRDARLARFVPEFEVREQGIVAGCPAVPDALIELVMHGDLPKRMLVELDRGSESLTVLRRKFQVLQTARTEGALRAQWHPFDLVVALDVAGARREAAVRGLLAEEWCGPWHVWNDSTDLVAELGILGRRLQTTVAESRGRNGSEAPANADGTAFSTVTGRGPSDDR